MTFPSGQQINTTNLDSPDDDPSLARVDILALTTAFNQLVASENGALGVLVLDSSGKVNGSYLPGTFNPSGALTLQPSNGVVNIRNVLRLHQINTEDLGSVTGTTTPTAGDMCYLVDGDVGQPCLSVYDGSNWRIVRLATTVGTVGSTLTATSTLSATADL